MKYLRIFLAALLIFLLVYFYKVHFGWVLTFFDNNNLQFALPVIALLILSQLLQDASHASLLKSSGTKVKTGSVFTAGYISSYLNLAGSGINGEDYNRSYYLKESDDVDISVNTTVMWINRVLSITALVIAASLTYAVANRYFAAEITLLPANAFILLIVLAVLPLFFMLLLTVPRLYSLAEPLLTNVFFGKQAPEVASTIKSMFQRRLSLFTGFICHLLSHLAVIFAISLIAYSLFDKASGSSLHYAVYAGGIAGIVLLAGQLPISAGNIGWTEWLADVLFRLAGFEIGATLFITWRIASLIAVVPGALLYYQQGGRKRLLEIIEIHSEGCIDDEDDE